MNNQNLREVLTKIQHYLSESDRKRLQQATDNLALDNTLRLTHQLPEQNTNESVRLLNELPTTMPLLTAHDRETGHILLSQQKSIFDNNNTLINSNNTNINPVTVVLGGRSKSSLSLEKEQQLLNLSTTTGKCLLIFILLSIILTILTIVGSIYIMRLKATNDQNVNDRNIIEHLEVLESKIERLTRNLTKKIENLDDQRYFIEGERCSCHERCREHGSLYGACGNGSKCICRNRPIKEEDLRDECSCGEWCKKRGYANGGSCGDGYTCICSK